MDLLVVDVQLTPNDGTALRRYVQQRAKARRSGRDVIVQSIITTLVVFVLLAALYFAAAEPAARYAILAVLLLFACVVTIGIVSQRRERPKPGSPALSPMRYEFDAGGVRVIRDLQHGFVDWRAIESIGEAGEHFFFFPLEQRAAYVVPKRQIVEMAPEAFGAQVRTWHADRRGQSAPPIPPISATPAGATMTAAIAAPTEIPTAPTGIPNAAPTSMPSAAPTGVPTAALTGVPSAGAISAPIAAAASGPFGFWSSLRANLRVGLRTFFFRPVQSGEIVSSFDQVAALLLIALAVAAVLDRATAGSDVVFTAYGAYTWFALLLAGLWLSALLARAMSSRADTRTMLVAGLATAPWVLIAAALLALVFGDHEELRSYVLLAVMLWAGIRVVRVVFGAVTRKALLIMVAFLVAITVAQNYLYFDTHLWSEPYDADDDDASTNWQDAEATFYDQPGFIDESVAKLAPQRPGIDDFYFLGFAGDGFQRVFRREALFGQQAFASQLGTGTRSLELINDVASRNDFALATPTGLRYALMRIGEAMDPAEDIVVLFLTSHGSQDGISVRNGVTPGDSALAPDDVRSALDDAGIRWRIVIVSACYAGVFVEPLKSDNTMIITAADSQHTSFGCADDRDLTYFGEAFLKDALPTAPSLAAAFEQARQEIARREKQEQLTPSNPQMWVGASMAKKLAQLGPLPLGTRP